MYSVIKLEPNIFRFPSFLNKNRCSNITYPQQDQKLVLFMRIYKVQGENETISRLLIRPLYGLCSSFLFESQNCSENWKILLWIIFMVFQLQGRRFTVRKWKKNFAHIMKSITGFFTSVMWDFVASNNKYFACKLLSLLWSDYRWKLTPAKKNSEKSGKTHKTPKIRRNTAKNVKLRRVGDDH